MRKAATVVTDAKGGGACVRVGSGRFGAAQMGGAGNGCRGRGGWDARVGGRAGVGDEATDRGGRVGGTGLRAQVAEAVAVAAVVGYGFATG